MLLAVLEKRGGFKFAVQDVFLNVAGGMRVEDPAIDLAVAVSLFSSYEDLPISDKLCFAGEVGLGGEIRAVSRIEARINEAEKLGFKRMCVSKYNRNEGEFKKSNRIEIIPVGNLQEVFDFLNN